MLKALHHKPPPPCVLLHKSIPCIWSEPRIAPFALLPFLNKNRMVTAEINQFINLSQLQVEVKDVCCTPNCPKITEVSKK